MIVNQEDTISKKFPTQEIYRITRQEQSIYYQFDSDMIGHHNVNVQIMPLQISIRIRLKLTYSTINNGNISIYMHNEVTVHSINHNMYSHTTAIATCFLTSYIVGKILSLLSSSMSRYLMFMLSFGNGLKLGST